MGTIAVPTEAARLHYVVESELETPPPPGTRVSAAGAAAARPGAPPLPAASRSVPARSRASPGTSRREAATRSRRRTASSLFLSTNYRYSLSKRETLGRSARGVPLRPALGQLRVLLGRARRHAPEPRHPGSRRRRLPARRVEPVRPVLHGAAARRALLGRGVLRWRSGWMTLRSVARARSRSPARALGLVAAARRRPHALVSLRRQLEPAGPAGDGRRPSSARPRTSGWRSPGRRTGAASPGSSPRRGAARRGRARVAGLARSLPGRGGPIRAHAALLRARPAPARAARARARPCRDGPPVLRPRGRAHRSAPLPWRESPPPTSAPASGRNR